MNMDLSGLDDRKIDSKVCIVDYGMGNIGSVKNTLTSLGLSVTVSAEKEDLASATHLILPGVGSFVAGMKNIKDRELDKILHEEVVQKNKKDTGHMFGYAAFCRRRSGR